MKIYILAIVVLYSLSFSLAQPVKNAGELICSATPVVVNSGGIVKIRAWTNYNYNSIKWFVESGNIQRKGDVLEWSLKAIPQGKYHAAGEVKGDDGAILKCNLEVLVLPGERGMAPGMSLLLNSKEEVSGFGAYTYLLFGGRPTTPELKTKYLNAIQAMLAHSPEVEQIRKYFPKSAISISHIPVKTSPPGKDVLPDALWILNNYDYARANYFLQKVQSDGRLMVLASSLEPLNSVSTKPAIVQDLSLVPSNIVTIWIRDYMVNIDSVRDWNKLTPISLFVRARTIIAIVSGVQEDVLAQIVRLVSLVK